MSWYTDMNGSLFFLTLIMFTKLQGRVNASLLEGGLSYVG